MNVRNILVAVLIGSSTLFGSNLSDEAVFKLIQHAKNSDKKIKALEIRLQNAEKKISDLEQNNKAKTVVKKSSNITKIEQPNLLNEKKHIEKIESNSGFVDSWAVKFREKSDLNSSVSAYRKLGDSVKILKVDGDWLKTNFGYVRNLYINRCGANDTIKVIPTRDAINIRKVPIFNKENIVKTAKYRDVLEVYNCLFLDNWYLLKDKSGFVNKKIVKVVKEGKK